MNHIPRNTDHGRQLDFGNKLESTVINMVTVSCGLVSLLYLFYTIPAEYYRLSVYNVAGALICLAIYIFNKRKLYNYCFWTFALLIPPLILGYVYEFGFINSEIFLLPSAILTSYLAAKKKYWPEIVWGLISLEYMAAKALLLFSDRIIDLTDTERLLFLPNSLLGLLLIYFSTRFFKKQQEAKTTVLEEERSELAESNALKEKLLSLVSHDLRSPFSSMKALIAMRQDGDLSEEQWTSYMGKLGHEIDRTASFIDNILFWVKQQMDGIEVQNQLLDVNEIVHVNLLQMQSSIDEKQITVHESYDSNTQISGDIEMLGIIVRNILTNAVKFTQPKTGAIWISTKKTAEYLQLEIKDNGIGMTQETMNQLWKGRLPSSKGTSQEKGFGIGMQLAKTFIDMLHIDLYVTSEKDKGSSFLLHIPLQQDVSQA